MNRFKEIVVVVPWESGKRSLFSIFSMASSGISWLLLKITCCTWSLNPPCLMAGMVPAMTLAMKSVPASHKLSEPAFWFIMSMALLVGFITAYPMNWWLVSRHMKHGMMTVRPSHESVNGGSDKTMHDDLPLSERTGGVQRASNPPMDGDAKAVSNSVLTWMTIFSFAIFGLGLSIAVIFDGL